MAEPAIAHAGLARGEAQGLRALAELGQLGLGEGSEAVGEVDQIVAVPAVILLRPAARHVEQRPGRQTLLARRADEVGEPLRDVVLRAECAERAGMLVGA